MSSVTSVILSFDDLPDKFDGETLPIVNQYLLERSYSAGLVDIKDPTLPRHWTGGGKVMQCDLALGAFNHFGADELNAFIEFLKALPWRPEGESVQLMYKREHDTAFTVVTIFEAEH